jgi:hypothetical protein
MKALVIKHGLDLFNRNACLDYRGQPKNLVEVVIRQRVPIPAKQWNGPCPDSIPANRKWVCSSFTGYVSGGITGGQLGDLKNRAGVGVSGDIRRLVGPEKQYSFGGRKFERIQGDVYLVDYYNWALQVKEAHDDSVRRENLRLAAVADRERAQAQTAQIRAQNIAAFRAGASRTLIASQRLVGNLVVAQMAQGCFPTYAPQTQCKDFRIDSYLYRSPSRADSANGITAIVDVKASALRKTDPQSQWREFCDSSSYIQIGGKWRHSNSYHCGGY